MTTATQARCDIKDVKLAPPGKKRILWADRDMPVLARIRERFEANRRLEPVLVLDQSINQTLSRTIMTKVTTLIVVVSLLVLGGTALRGFSEALVIGILVGTYSSIYISAAVALDLGLKAEHVFPTVRSKIVDSLP